MEAKRQARMKNILENSEARIKRILQSKMEFEEEGENSEVPVVHEEGNSEEHVVEQEDRNLQEPEGQPEGRNLEEPEEQPEGRNLEEPEEQPEGRNLEPSVRVGEGRIPPQEDTEDEAEIQVPTETSSDESTGSQESVENATESGSNANQDPSAPPNAMPNMNAGTKKVARLRNLFYRFGLLGIAIRLAICLGYGYTFAENITIPFTLLMAAEMALSSIQSGVSEMAVTVPLSGIFFGASDGMKEAVQFLYTLFNILLTYFLLYFFTFIITHIVVEFLGY